MGRESASYFFQLPREIADEAELEWQYEREINTIEQMWDPPNGRMPEEAGVSRPPS
jgi:hypothetical protein